MAIKKRLCCWSVVFLILSLFIPSFSQAVDVAYLHGNTGGQTSLRDYLESHFDSLTLLDGNGTQLPAVSDLAGFDVIIASSNHYWTLGEQRAAEIGNLLADYVDGGGHLILTPFSGQGAKNCIAGRLATGAYLPFAAGGALYGEVYLGEAPVPDHAVLNGIRHINGYYRDNVTLTDGTQLIANWNDGVPLAAISAQGVLGINLFPEPFYGHLGGDYKTLFVNAVNFAAAAPPKDTTPPEDVTDINLEAFADRLVLSWQPSDDSAGDLAGYRVYFNNGPGENLSSNAVSFEKTGLSPFSAYTFRISAFDQSGNESASVQVTGVTLLANPGNIQVVPGNGILSISWEDALPADYVKGYNVYLSDSIFSSVTGMVPRKYVEGTSVVLSGLINQQEVFVAVTAVNLSGGEASDVTAVAATPVSDTTGPAFADPAVGGVPLADSNLVQHPGSMTLTISDPAGISRVDVLVDGVAVYRDFSGSSSFSYELDTGGLTDGDHVVTLVAYDRLWNPSTVEYPVTVQLAPPPAPIITQPAGGAVFNEPRITLTGQAEKYSQVVLFNNDQSIGSAVSVEEDGTFQIDLALAEGGNRLQAAAQNRAGQGIRCAEIPVVLDTSVPMPPTGIWAEAGAGGEIRLSWAAPLESNAKGYHVYRSPSSFDTAPQGVRVNQYLITGTAFKDLTPADGRCYYRISSVDEADNESALSTQVFADADSTLPRAVSITCAPQGNFDPASGRMAPGLVDVLLEVTEPLQAVPFLTFTPDGGNPISVDLRKTSELIYTGYFLVSETTPSGPAYAVFSARDVVGNRGTEIDAGGVVQIDTDGPAVQYLSVQPLSPIRNDLPEAVEVTAVIGITETVAAGGMPELTYLLSGDGRSPQAITDLSETDTRPGDAQTFQARFFLPPDAGALSAESLQFGFLALDDLGNAGNQFLCENLVQVYQGDLVPLEPPSSLEGKSLPAGQVRLTWNAVDGAAGYRVYRKSAAGGEFAVVSIPLGSDILEWIDTPPEEGNYVYAVASIREFNGQQAESGLSESLEAASDASAPPSPFNLTLALTPQGIRADWDTPQYAEAVTFRLYRSDQLPITVLDGLVPVRENISQNLAIDESPSVYAHSYAVTAVDEAGNESEPSNTFYLNFELLPVSALQVVQSEYNPPEISWTPPAETDSISGYALYLQNGAEQVQLGSSLIAGLSYVDEGYDGKARTYRILTVDHNQTQSMPRTITLPQIQAQPVEGSVIERGVMNRLEYEVQNLSDIRVDNIRLKVRVNSYEHLSDTFSLDSNARAVIPVGIGGYDDLEDYEELTTTIQITPNVGESVEIVRSSEIRVETGMLVLQILNDEFQRGGTGQVRFRLENTGAEEIEVITAQNSGKAVSEDVVFHLADEDGNVISTANFKQVLGSSLVNLGNHNSVARIPPGHAFLSDPLNMTVPGNAPNDLTLVLNIANVYYHHGKDNQVCMEGLSTTHAITLVDTAYYAEITGITPEQSFGDQDIAITGRTVERATGNLIPRVPVNLTISVDGFDRRFDLFSDADGNFSYTFTPLASEGGEYWVRAVHPDLLDRPVQARFWISRINLTPHTINLNIPKNYEKAIPVKALAAVGTEADQLRLVWEAADQPGGALQEGIHLELPEPMAIGSGRAGNLAFTIWADNSAAASSEIVLKLVSGAAGDEVWGTVHINARFSEAKPALLARPSYVETGVSQGASVSEVLTLGNAGLAPFYDAQLSLVDQNGNFAPDWVQLHSETGYETIAVGEEVQASLLFSPDAAVNAGIHTYYLRIASSNYPTLDVPLFVTVTPQGEGNIFFKVRDIYTGTLGDDDQLIQGLAGVQVYVQNEAIPTLEYTGTTDLYGEAGFNTLPQGKYKCRITAKDHSPYTGTVWIKPGLTATQDVFLEYSLVTVDWDVQPVTIKDRYEVVTQTTYKTDVPVALVVAEPAKMTLPAMKPGDVYVGEVTFTNHGLVRAEEISYVLPESNFFQYEILRNLPESLGSKESVTIPYRVTCLENTTPTEDGTGGGCVSEEICGELWYLYTCSDGTVHIGVEDTCISNTYCNETQTSSDGNTTVSRRTITQVSVQEGRVVVHTRGTISISIGELSYVLGGNPIPGYGSGTVSSPSPGKGTGSGSGSSSVGGVKCGPKRYCRVDDICCQLLTCLNVRSDVDLINGEYKDDIIDMAVKVPGYQLTVRRRYFDEAWHIRLCDQEQNLQIEYAADGKPDSIYKDGVYYQRADEQGTVYAFGLNNHIYVVPEGFRWETKAGDWSLYDANGRLTSYGKKNNLKVSLLYEPGGDGRLVGVADNNGVQVLWYEYDLEGRLASVTDAEGRSVIYQYHLDHRLASIADLLGNETIYAYDDQGRLAQKTSPLGESTYISYDEYGYVTSVVGDSGFRKDFAYGYDESSQVSYAEITHASGLVEEIWFDNLGRRIRKDVNGRNVEKAVFDGRNKILIDGAGNRTTRTYDEWKNLVGETFPDGSEVSYKYAFGATRFNLIEKVDERGIVTRYEYDSADRLVRQTEAFNTPDEQVREFTYDGDGNPLTITIQGDANTAEAVAQMTYDGYGNRQVLTDPEGNQWHFTHDIMGNMLTKESPDGQVWQYEYDSMGRLTKTTDPLGGISTVEYDAAGNKIRETDPAGNVTSYEYDPDHRLIRTTDPNGSITRYTYNPDGKPTSIIDPEGNAAHNTYDADGRLLKATDAAGNEVVYVYDDTVTGGCASCIGQNEERPVEIIYPTFNKRFQYDFRGHKVSEKDVLSDTDIIESMFEYDAAGNLIAQTDKEGKTTLKDYDSLNRLVMVVDPMNNPTTFAYDDRDNLIALTDAAGHTTRFEYDRNGRKVKEIRPMGQVTAFTYDAAGRLQTKTDPKGQRTEYQYDAAGRMIQARYYAEGDLNPVKTVDYTYDASGKLLSYDDGQTTGIFTYDPAGRKLSESIDYGPFTLSYSYTYYADGTKASFTGPDGATYQYYYDEGNRLAAIEVPELGVISYQAFVWNRPTRVVFPDGSTQEFDFDALMRPSRISANNGTGSQVINYQYAYDKMGHVVAKATGNGAHEYDYDDLYRLVKATRPDTVDDEVFNYDPVGNRTFTQEEGGSLIHDENNALLSVGSTSYEYDANGSMVRHMGVQGMTTFDYNVEDRLSRVTDEDGNVIAIYYYDPFGRRLWKDVDGERIYFFYSDEGLIGEYDEYGNEKKSYGWKPGGQWGTAPLSMKAEGEFYFYQNDHLGTPQIMIAVTGEVVWEARYKVFGEAEVLSGSMVVNNLRFPGQYVDAETGLHYNWQRYYDPEVGRYLKADPIGFAGGINLYVYVQNNPVNFVDPFGLIGLNTKLSLQGLVIKFLRGVNVASPFPLEVLNPQPEMRALLKVNPITGAIVGVFLDPAPLHDPYLSNDGKWCWPDGTPVDSNCP